MKTKKLALLITVLIVTGYFGFSVLTGVLPLSAAGGPEQDFAAFKENRLSLPVRHETISSAEAALFADLMSAPEAEAYLERFTSVMLPPACRLAKNGYGDLDGDGSPEEYFLADGKIKVVMGADTWESPANWWVDDFFLGDANNDGISELNLLVWKAGSFGSSKPFWVREEDHSIKNHLFIMKLRKGTLKAVWQSSNLDRPNYRGALTDLDGDGQNELVVIEGSYADPAEKQLTIWQWNGWGFFPDGKSG